ncbi:MAG: hypothetical protein AAGG69_02165 [Pseudomonadota bacterium]
MQPIQTDYAQRPLAADNGWQLTIKDLISFVATAAFCLSLMVWVSVGPWVTP